MRIKAFLYRPALLAQRGYDCIRLRRVVKNAQESWDVSKSLLLLGCTDFITHGCNHPVIVVLPEYCRTGDEGVRTGDSSIIPFEVKHADYFRTRKVVRMAAEDDTIVISARLKIAQYKVKELQSVFDAAFADDGIRLDVGISKPFRVDNKLEAYGPVVPIHRTPNEQLACGSSVGVAVYSAIA